jgi:hypothetical protein
MSTQAQHTNPPRFGGPVPLAPYPAHAVPLGDRDVAELLATLRARYLYLADPETWRGQPAGLADVATQMAAGVKLCLDDLEWFCRNPRPL